jgi:hypothetical protein
MYLSDEPLHISVEVMDTLFVHALRDSVAKATPPSDAWEHIAQTLQRFPAHGDFATSRLSQASSMPLTDQRPRL